ncbi:MAG: hypothetical protein H7X84_03885 [Verrucomicrobia bacterium]|nr:hypothetical protein [Prolixibacteraceae bacterium]
MEIGIILLATVAATSLMTAFSYLVSEGFRELYKEPVLLQYLMTRFNFGITGIWKIIAGWTVHYIIGLIFVVIFHILWRWGLYEITWLTGLIYGIVIGIIGIGGWVVMFILSNYKPRIDFKGYYLQLFIAHLVFAMTTVFVYKIML